MRSEMSLPKGHKSVASSEISPPDSASESAPSYESEELKADLSVLYEQKKYHEILVLAPLVLDTTPRSHSRLVLALTLFKIGRPQAALRDLSVAIENEPVSAERERLMSHLVEAFKDLGRLEHANACLEEMVVIARTSADPSAAQRVAKYEGEIQSLSANREMFQKRYVRPEEMRTNISKENKGY